MKSGRQAKMETKIFHVGTGVSASYKLVHEFFTCIQNKALFLVDRACVVDPPKQNRQLVQHSTDSLITRL